MTKALVLTGGGARGAFQAGVWKFLDEIHWQPDIICGASIGAINGAGIATGMAGDALARMWMDYGQRRLCRINLGPFLRALLTGQGVAALLDTTPLQRMILEHVDFHALKTGRIRLVISAVNLVTGRPEFFDQDQIGMAHIMASSAMPLIFPWQEINGVPYWDGGVMSNAPLTPALEYGADDIIVVQLSPVSHHDQPVPRNIRGVGEHLFEQLLAGSGHASLVDHGFRKTSPARPGTSKDPVSGPQHPRSLVTLAPSRMLGLTSLLKFSPAQIRRLIDDGYHVAQRALGRKWGGLEKATRAQ